MVKRNKLTEFLNNYLKIDKFEDTSSNGLQVVGKEKVKKVVLGVSASLEFFQKAVKEKTDLIIVHHGIFWSFMKFRADLVLKKRLKILFDNNITLLGYHLPLDAHPKIGNNAQIAKKLGVKITEKFGEHKGQSVGFKGELKKAENFKDLVKRVNRVFETKSWYLQGGKSRVKTLAFVSGGGSRLTPEAIDKKVDVYLTGETQESLPALIKESGINYIAAGHYNSEKFGIKALGKIIKKEFPSLEIKFIDIPNPL